MRHVALWACPRDLANRGWCDWQYSVMTGLGWKGGCGEGEETLATSFGNCISSVPINWTTDYHGHCLLWLSQIHAMGKHKEFNMAFMVAFTATTRVPHWRLWYGIVFIWLTLFPDGSSALRKGHLYLMNTHLLRVHGEPSAVSLSLQRFYKQETGKIADFARTTCRRQAESFWLHGRGWG